MAPTPRGKITKPTSLLSQAPLMPKPKCNAFRDLIQKATWFRVEVQNHGSVEEPRKVAAGLIEHLNSSCRCTPSSSVQLIVASTFLHEFFLLSKAVIDSMNDLERELKEKADVEGGSSQEATAEGGNKNDANGDEYKSDFNEKFESKFVSKVNNRVTIAHLKHLLKPALSSLSFYEKAFNCNQTDNALSEKIVTSSFVLSNLNALCQIFTFYDLPNFAFRAVDTACRYVQLLGPPNEAIKVKFSSPEEVQITFCNMVRLLINFGCLNTAIAFFKRHFVDQNFETANIETFGHGLMFLLNVEIALRTRKSLACKDKLRSFLDSEYFTKNTIKRYSIKIMTLLLASKFPSAVYKFSNNFTEFSEPVQMAVSVCKRWKMLSSFFKPNPNQLEDQPDPLWYRYLMFNLVSETGEVFTHFFANTGMVSDSSFYYKMVLNLNLVTLNVIGISKIFLTGADFDCKNGFSNDAKSKLNSIKVLFTSSSPIDSALFQQKKSKKPVKNVTICQSPNDEFADAEATSLISNVITHYHKAVALARNQTFQPNYDDFIEKVKVDDIAKLVIQEFDQLKKNGAIFHSLFYITMKWVAINLMTDYEEGTYDWAVRHCSQFLLLLENFTIKCHFKGVQKMASESCFIPSIKTTMEEQLFNGPSAPFFWHVTVFYVKKMVDGELYKEALCFLNKLTDFSTYSYETRVYRCIMFYYRGLVVYRLLKPTFINERTPIFTVGCDRLLHKPTVSSFNGSSTPIMTRSRAVPSAPKRTIGTVQKYASSLFDKALNERVVVGKESLEGRRRIVNAQSLNFDDHYDNTHSVDPSIKATSQRIKNVTVKADGTKSSEALKMLNESEDDDGILVEDATSKFGQLCIELFDKAESSESYFAKEFNVSEFVINFDLSRHSLEDVKNAINKVMCYVGLHPTWSLYQDTQLLSFKYARAKNKIIGKTFYHLSETADHASYRYRSIMVAQRKAALKLLNSGSSCTPNFTNLQFKFDDFEYLPIAKELPKAWRFLQIKFYQNGTKVPDLLFARFQASGKHLFFKVQTRNQEKLSKFFLDEFEDIMKGNNSSMCEVDRHIYWKIRHEYDHRLSVLLKSFEDSFIGPFKSLLLGEVDNLAYRAACSNFKKALNASATRLELKCVDTQLLDVFVESVLLLENTQLETGAQILFNFNDSKLTEGLSLSKLKKKYFKEWSTEKKIAQLFAGVAPVGLILEGALSQFPFESCPSVRKMHQPIFRVPSLRVAAILYKQHKELVLANGVDDSSCYYVINPANNLKQTDAFFRDKFGEICKRETNWEGIIGSEPTIEDWKLNLENRSLYIYFGHGSGSIYYRKVPNGGIDSLQLKPTSIVIGCSSGRVYAEGKIEPVYGVPYRFLLNGSPCYIGNLWDVTDKDIDAFSDKFLETALKRWKPESSKISSFSRAISSSRDSCRLTFLIGSAPVVFGLPLNCLL